MLLLRLNFYSFFFFFFFFFFLSLGLICEFVSKEESLFFGERHAGSVFVHIDFFLYHSLIHTCGIIAQRARTISLTCSFEGLNKTCNTDKGRPRSKIVPQPDPEGEELRLEDVFVGEGLAGVEHDEDEVARPGGGDDLPSAALSLGGALNDFGEVEHLNFGSLD